MIYRFPHYFILITALLLSSAQSLLADVGILTGRLDALIKPYGRMTFTKGIQVAEIETLNNVIIRLNNGHRIDIESITLEPTEKEGDIDIQAKNVFLEPTGSLLLLRSRQLSFIGSDLIFQQLLIGRPSFDSCKMIGESASLTLGKFGMILENKDRDNILAQDRKFFSDEIIVEHSISGNVASCTAKYLIQTDEFGTDFGGRSGASLQDLDISINMPGSLQSLRRDRAQVVEINADMGTSSNRIFGGALGWSFKKGEINIKLDAISLVSPITYFIRNTYSDDFSYWSRLWNSSKSIAGRIDFAFDKATMRTANVMPNELIAKFRDAGLTTMLLESSGSIESNGKEVVIDGNIDITGLFNTNITALIRPDDFPEDEDFFKLFRFIPGSTVLPLHIEEMNLRHKDKGFLIAFESIFEVPIFVRLNQWADSVLQSSAPGYREDVLTFTRKISDFFSNSASETPAGIRISTLDDLDTREISVIVHKSPEAITELLDILVEEP